MFSGVLNTLADGVVQGEKAAFALAQADEEFERRYAEQDRKRRAPRALQSGLRGLVAEEPRDGAGRCSAPSG